MLWMLYAGQILTDLVLLEVCLRPCCVFEWEEHDTSSCSIAIDLLLDGWKKFNVFLCNTIFFLCVSPSPCFLREPMPLCSAYFLREPMLLCPRLRPLFVLDILHLNEVLSVPILSHILKSSSSQWSYSFFK